MALLTWDDSYSVGVAEIDKQHKRLFDLINDLFDAMKVGKAKDVIEKVIKELANYTVYHFGYEEKYFDQFGYSETAAHKKEHKDFVDTVSKFQSEFASGNALLSMEVMSFLKKWLQGHIKGTDQHYTEFFHEHGMN